MISIEGSHRTKDAVLASQPGARVRNVGSSGMLWPPPAAVFALREEVAG